MSKSKQRPTITIRLDPELMEWMRKKKEEKRFGSYTHGIEEALTYLRRAMEKGEK